MEIIYDKKILSAIKDGKTYEPSWKTVGKFIYDNPKGWNYITRHRNAYYGEHIKDRLKASGYPCQIIALQGNGLADKDRPWVGYAFFGAHPAFIVDAKKILGKK